MKFDKGLREVLAARFGGGAVAAIRVASERRLGELLAKAEAGGKSANQMRVLRGTILPRVALYLALAESYGEEAAYDAVREYMLAVVAVRMGGMYALFSKLPGFFWMFRKGSAAMLARSDAWDVAFVCNDRDSIAYNIKRCLWYDACVENGCPGLCEAFCDADDVIYGGVDGVRFERCGTLAKGYPCCDFLYSRNK